VRPLGDSAVRGFPSAVLAGNPAVTHEGAFLGTSAALFLASAGVTVAWCGSMSGGMPMPGGWTMSMAWMRMPGQSWAGAAACFMGMWTVMMVAMMMPSLAPMLSGYRRSLVGSRWVGLTALAGTGYFSVWVLLGAAAYPLGVGLAASEMQWPAVARSVPAATGVLLLLAGSIQLSTWKARQLRLCRSACTCGPPRSPDTRGAFRHGLHLGVHCSLCCSGFMMVLLVSGVMDLTAMALVMAAITAERLGPRPDRIARVAGAVLFGVGIFILARALRSV